MFYVLKPQQQGRAELQLCQDCGDHGQTVWNCQIHLLALTLGTKGEDFKLYKCPQI